LIILIIIFTIKTQCVELEWFNVNILSDSIPFLIREKDLNIVITGHEYNHTFESKLPTHNVFYIEGLSKSTKKLDILIYKDNNVLCNETKSINFQETNIKNEKPLSLTINYQDDGLESSHQVKFEILFENDHFLFDSEFVKKGPKYKKCNKSMFFQLEEDKIQELQTLLKSSEKMQVFPFQRKNEIADMSTYNLEFQINFTATDYQLKTMTDGKHFFLLSKEMNYFYELIRFILKNNTNFKVGDTFISLYDQNCDNDDNTFIIIIVFLFSFCVFGFLLFLGSVVLIFSLFWFMRKRNPVRKDIFID
jgi:hypothetical protein